MIYVSMKDGYVGKAIFCKGILSFFFFAGVFDTLQGINEKVTKF